MEKTKGIWEIYGNAKELATPAIKLNSTDECTRRQAKEKLTADQLLKKGKPRRVGYEYLRDGTLWLTANFEIATGQIESSTINEPRTELDVTRHLTETDEKRCKRRKGGLWWIN